MNFFKFFAQILQKKIFFRKKKMVMGIGLPIEVQDNSITMGAVVKSYYELPNNVTQYTNPTIDIERKKRRRRATPSRWDIYNTLQDFIKR